MVVALGATPAAGKASAGAPGTASVTTSSTIIDPVTGQPIVVAFVQETTMAAVSPAAEPTEPGIKCVTKASAYVIYFPIPYVELLRWKFVHTWCWERKLVTSVRITDSLLFKNTVIRQSGNGWAQTISQLPRNTVRTVLQGMHFQYCPLIGPGVVSCIANFDPVIDVYVSWGGVYTDMTTL
jgi:hypothetical protein